MRYQHAHRTARAAEQALDLPQQVTLQSLRTMIADQRQQDIVIDELPGLPGTDICGLWLVLADKDVILHAPTRSAWHRQQIILHEFSHMILCHDLDATSGDFISDLLPGFDAASIRLAFHRDSFGNEVELTAEILADRLAAASEVAAAKPASTCISARSLADGEVFG